MSKRQRATNVSARLSEEEKQALNVLSAQEQTDVADIVRIAIFDKWGKDINRIKKFLSRGEHENSLLNAEELSA